MKNSDYVICFRRGGGRYTMLDLGSVVEAASHRRALEIFLRKVGVYAYVRIVTVRGDHDNAHEGRCSGIPESNRDGVQGVF